MAYLLLILSIVVFFIIGFCCMGVSFLWFVLLLLMIPLFFNDNGFSLLFSGFSTPETEEKRQKRLKQLKAQLDKKLRQEEKVKEKRAKEIKAGEEAFDRQAKYGKNLVLW